MAEQTARFGHTELRDAQEAALRKARRLEWATIACQMGVVALVMVVMGSSQAMKAAWVEDCLAFLPPIAFLIGAKVAARRPDRAHPYGWHRAVGAGHLASAVALLGMGCFIAVDSAMTLVKGEHPTIATMKIFGHAVWLGWLMIGTMIVTSIPPVVLGRLKLKVADELHDKVLYADADMNKADWQTALGACLGIMGIGLGLWWADSVVALFISAGIVKDGVTNVRNAVRGLMDAEATTYDDEHVHPVIGEVERALLGLPWVGDARARVRDEGHVFHTEVFVVPRGEPGFAQLEQASALVRGLDWKLRDTVVIPVRAMPDDLAPR